MRAQRFGLMFVVLLFIFFVSHNTHAKLKMPDTKIAKEEGPVDISADELIYNREGQLFQAHGNVEVIRGTLFLKADHAQLNTATKDLVAWGNVVLREEEDVLECERLEVNMNTRLGRIYQAKLFLKDQNFHITGQEAEKMGENRYRIRGGSFTTCDAKRPPWKFTVKELEVTLAGQGIVKGPIFYIEDTPFLYFPWAIFPIRKERQTGFLLPELGYSSSIGAEVKTAFFWAIAKDMDATFYLDFWGKRGFKEGLEFRYALTQDTKGQANFYFIDDHVFDGNRYAIFFQHQQKLPYDFYLKANISHVSDRFYTIDFDDDLPEEAKIDSRSRRQLRSVLFGGKNWDQFSFLVKGAVYNDLTKERNDETVQELPQIRFSAHPQPLFKTPFFYDLTSSYTQFSREKGVEAHRWDLFPRVSYPLRLFNVLKLEANLGLRETIYKSFNDPTDQIKGWKSRPTLEAGMELSTEFFRVYDGSAFQKISNLFKVAKWMHTIEPSIGYLYHPRVDQDDLPSFDEIDRIPFTSQITYGITQRLVGKPLKEGVESGPYEYAKLKIYQSYSLGDPFENDENNKGRHLSNIRAELWWYFSPYVTARWNAEFNPHEGNFETFNGSLTVKDQRNDAVQLVYRYTKDNINTINLYTRLKTISPLYLYGIVRYNFLDKIRVENVYGAEYQAQCWSLGLLFEDKNQTPNGTHKREYKFRVYLNLLGVGAIGPKPSFMGVKPWGKEGEE